MSGFTLMRVEDLVLWRHLASGTRSVVVVASAGAPAWLAALPRPFRVVPALDRNARGQLSSATVVLLDGPHAVDPAILTALQHAGAEVLYWHGGRWRVRSRGMSKHLWSLRELARRLLPASWFGIVRLQRPFEHVAGACYWASLGSLRVPEPDDDAQALLFENGNPMPLRGCVHEEIFRHGGGRYSVWALGVYFSTPDGSDPRTNGRVYEVQVTPEAPDTLLEPANEEQVFAGLFAAAAAKRSATAPDGKRVMLLIGSLAAGGAERQFCNLAKGLARRGHEVAIASIDGLAGAAGHYLPLLDGTPVRLIDASHASAAFEPGALEQRVPGSLALLQRLPDIFAADAWRLATHVAQFSPDILHCALDRTNLLGAIAGVTLGVPRIVLSMRNFNPTNFPGLDAPWFRRWYEIAAKVPGLVLSANSRAGGADYATWLALPKARVHVVLNGFDASAVVVPGDDEVRSLRAEHGIGDGPVLAGVFRLSAEKRPQLWLDVVARLRQRFPRLRALHAGDGPDLDAVRERVRALGLQDTVTLLGRRSDPMRVIRAADVLLLVSTLEGIPNVALEAQWLERPVVCTEAGGSIEAVQHGVTGFVVAGALPEQELEHACARLLGDAGLRARMGRAGREFVSTSFAVEVMVERSIALYRDSATR